MSKVLCAVDLSPGAEQVMREAGALAASLDAGVVVFHAFEGMPLVVGSMPEVLPAQVGFLEETKNSARAYLAKLAGPVLGARLARIEIESAAGSIHRAIVAHADAIRAAYVVVGAGAEKGFERLLLGKVAEKVVRHAHCPVLVTRPSPDRAAVLAAVDLSPVSQAAIREAAREARRRKVALVVLHCLELGPETRTTFTADVPLSPEEIDTRPALRRRAHEEMEGWLASAGVRDARLVIEDGAPVSSAVDLARRLPAGLVVVGTTGRTGLERLLLGSVAEGITHKAPCSVLAVRKETRGLVAVPPEHEEEGEEDELAPLDGGLLRVPADIPETEEQRLERMAAADEHEEQVRKGPRLGKL
jgi:nucleotide-binding universal stress UspA family protein